jgi:Trk K+ transport system NAD-binding subunit/Kef-type K+ transport system membrane component KefB
MQTLEYTIAFAVICLASYLIGQGFKWLRLPTITGYLFAGALVGSFGLDFLPSSASESLRFVDEIALAVIAFVAGSELYLKELKPRLRPILFSTGGILAVTFVAVAVAVYFLTALLPFTADWAPPARLATALLGAAVLLALSPPSTIAVIKEVHARGPFTRTALGVTVLMDVVIIVLFAIATSLAGALLTGTSLSVSFLALLALDLGLAVGIGWVAGQLLKVVLGQRWPRLAKTALVLAVGFGVYELASWVKTASVAELGFEIYIEPLLIAMIAGFIVTNFTRFRDEFDQILHDVGPAVYVAFFTITGLALKLDLLWATLPVAAALFFVRMAGIGIGTAIGTTLAGESGRVRAFGWMAFITQAGIALGLAREVAVQFPDLGNAFATLIISVVVLNEIFGPIFLKSVLKRVGEANIPTGKPGDEARGALILGVEGQSVALARTLGAKGWRVVMADPDAEHIRRLAAEDVDERHIPAVTEAVLDELLADDTAAVVALLPDDAANLRALRYASERYGVERLVVRPAGRRHAEAFAELGAFVVDPATALVALLDRAVRAPQSAALLLRQDPDRSVVQLRVSNPDLEGVPLRDLRLPLDVLFLEVSRNGSAVVPSGHTVLHRGDEVTLVAKPGSLDEARLRLVG